MSRLFSLLVLAVILWLFLEIGWTRLRKAFGPKRPASPLGSPEAGEALVRCAVCGVHVPRSRALARAGGEVFCERCR